MEITILNGNPNADNVTFDDYLHGRDTILDMIFNELR